MKPFRGLYPPLITPFDDQGRVDEQALRDHVDFMIAGGVDGMCAGSSTGEFMNLSWQEWERTLQIVKAQTAGRVPLIAGGADMSTAATIDRSRFAEQLGFDGLLVISPWYQVHTQREVYAHFKALRAAVSIPIMIYNNPPVTGLRLSVELLVRLAEEGVVQYLKDADSDPYARRLKMRIGDKLQLFYGHDNNALGAFAFGATGWVSGTANFCPELWSKFVHTCIDDGDFVKARQLWYHILPFVEIATVGDNGERRADWIAVIKRGLELRGRKVGSVRRPMLPLTEDVDARLQQAVAAMELPATGKRA